MIWFNSIKYNSARVIQRMADIIRKNDGRVRECEDVVEIGNRGYCDKMCSIQDRIDATKKHLLFIEDENRRNNIQKIIQKYENEYKKFEFLNATAPVIASRIKGIKYLSIEFVLDNTYYRFAFADNIFFPDTYFKIKLNENGEYYGQYYQKNVTPEDEVKAYFIDGLFTLYASEEAITQVAEDILVRLINEAPSKRYIETERIRVPNTYNENWHWETVTVKRSLEKHVIDF